VLSLNSQTVFWSSKSGHLLRVILVGVAVSIMTFPFPQLRVGG
jgi:hypothetical protein